MPRPSLSRRSSSPATATRSSARPTVSRRASPVPLRRVCEVLPHFEATHHFVADPYIRIDGDVAQVDTYCEAHHVGERTDMVLGLRYVDRFERRGGTWRIAKRVCAFDWTYTIPFDPAQKFAFGPDFTVGRRDRDDITYAGV